MKAVWKVCLLIIVISWLVSGQAVYANDSALPNQQAGACEELAPAIPENEIPQAAPAGLFFHREVTINVPPGPGWRLFLAEDCAGKVGPTADDQALIRNLITNQQWSWDFRSSDHQVIVALNEPVDLTSLVNPDVSTISLSLALVDVSPPAHSSSRFVIYWVYDPASVMSVPESPPQPVLIIPPTPVAAPTLALLPPTLTRVPSPSPTNLPTLTPILTPTPVTAVELPQSAEAGKSEEDRAWSQLLTWGWGTVTAIALLAGGVMWAFLHWWSATIPGAFDIYNHDQFWKTVSFERFHKNQLTFGSGPRVDVALSSDGVPAMAARIRLHRGLQGQRQAIWEVLAPDNPKEVLEQQLLEHQDELFIGNSYKLVYQHYQIEPSFMEGSLTNV